MNDRNALSIHTTVSLVLFGISVHDCILVSFQAERQKKRQKQTQRMRLRQI